MYPEDKKTGAATLPVNSYDLFTLISRIYHFLILARQLELRAHNISPQQFFSFTDHASTRCRSNPGGNSEKR